MTHPANPRTNLGDLSELEDSIREHGVLQDPVVMPAARVLAAWSAYTDTSGDEWRPLAAADWVVLMGARRRTAAGNLAGNDPAAPLHVLVREDAIADDPLQQLDVMTTENVARAPLTPLEEARAFDIQIRAGRGQRDIAARAGCSQPHVSKRLKLLKLPTSMLAALDTGQPAAADQDATADKSLQIKDALAYADAAGDSTDAQFVMLAAYKLGQHRPSTWTPKLLVDEVRREQARRVQHEALTRKAADEGVPVLADPEKRFGGYLGAREHRLEGKKAIAAARKADTLAAAVTDGGLVYYDTAGKPKKTDNRSDAEQQRITDDRERRVAMTARAEAAAVLAARPPKLPESAADIVDAWLWAPGSDVSTLAQKWLLAAGVGPDPQLPGHEWWQQIRAGAWPTRVHAAHVLGLARREVRAREYHRKWNPDDGAWLTRLTAEVGYTPTAWEQQRLAAIGTPAEPAGADHTVARVTLGWSVVDGWCVYVDDDPAPHDSAGVDIGRDDVDVAQRWAGESAASLDQEVTGWRPWTDAYGQPGYRAVLAGSPADPDKLGSDADAAPVEYRLSYDTDAEEWRLYAGERLLADHDCLTADAVDAALTWASGVLADEHARVAGWSSRVATTADVAGGVEYVAELT